MSEKKMDFAKVLAILAQPKETPPPLENVERRILNVPFMNCQGELDCRKMKIIIPANGVVPMPVLWIPHYEMGEDALELRDYLAEGWAVACPTESPADANGKITGDGVVYNNAALFMLRQMPEFDPDRVAIVGGSAGGYMTLMQMGTNLGICVAIANGPIANVYYNFNHCWPMAHKLNDPVLFQLMSQKTDDPDEIADNPMFNMMRKLGKLPIPFIAALRGSFADNAERFPKDTDVELWENITGTGVAHRFSGPVMVNHNTSDILVPVDQITRKYTYVIPGESLPADFDLRLPSHMPGNLRYTLEERLPQASTCVTQVIVPEGPQPDTDLPFDADKLFNLNILDDGAPEGYGSHSARMDVGRRRDVPYLKEMLGRTAAKTNVLTAGMLQYMLDLYNGKSIAYPVHKNADPEVYGSAAMYQKKVCMELSQWIKHHGKDSLMKVFSEVICRSNSTEAGRMEYAMEEILAQI